MRIVDRDLDAVVVQIPVRVSRAELRELAEALGADNSDYALAQLPSDTIAMPWDRGFLRDTRDIANSLLRLRRRRNQVLGTNLCADPAWDILLDLFIHQADGIAVSVSSACYASGVPMTTALRYINALEAENLVARRVAPHDKRSSLLSLTPTAMERIAYLLAAWAGSA